MNCSEFRQQWSAWRDGDVAADAACALVQHHAQCPACQRYDRQMRRMLDALAELPLPGARPEEQVPATAREAAAARRHPSRFVALAATLVIGIAIGVLVGNPALIGSPARQDAVVLAGAGVHEVQLAFESPAELDRVEFVVELPAGIEMVGFPGERTVRWESRLAKGRSRLRLPLRVTDDAAGGMLVARIVRDGKTQQLLVPLDVTRERMDSQTGGNRSA